MSHGLLVGYIAFQAAQLESLCVCAVVSSLSSLRPMDRWSFGYSVIVLLLFVPKRNHKDKQQLRIQRQQLF